MPSGTDTVKPLHIDDTWIIRDARPNNAATGETLSTIGRQVDGADVLMLHQPDGEPIVILSGAFWRRVLATVSVASGEPVPTMAGR